VKADDRETEYYLERTEIYS